MTKAGFPCGKMGGQRSFSFFFFFFFFLQKLITVDIMWDVGSQKAVL